MHITVLQPDLARALALVAPLADDGPLPQLGQVRLRADGGLLTLTVADPTVAVSVPVAATVRATGALAVPARRLAALVDGLAAGPVALEADGDGRRAVVRAGRSPRLLRRRRRRRRSSSRRPSPTGRASGCSGPSCGRRSARRWSWRARPTTPGRRWRRCAGSSTRRRWWPSTASGWRCAACRPRPPRRCPPSRSRAGRPTPSTGCSATPPAR